MMIAIHQCFDLLFQKLDEMDKKMHDPNVLVQYIFFFKSSQNQFLVRYP